MNEQQDATKPKLTAEIAIEVVSRDFQVKNLQADNFGPHTFWIDGDDFCAVIWPSRSYLEESDQLLIEEYIEDQVVEDNFDVDNDSLIRSIAGSCDLSELDPWITAEWKLLVYEQGKDAPRLEEFLADRLATFFDLTSDHPEERYKILVAQCRPNSKDLSRILYQNSGSAEGFGQKEYYTTSEGFIVDPDDDPTQELVKKLNREKKTPGPIPREP